MSKDITKKLKKLESSIELLEFSYVPLLAFLHSFPAPLWVKRVEQDDNGDYAFRIVMFNNAFIDQYGLSSESKYYGKTDFDIWSPEQAEARYLRDLKALERAPFMISKFDESGNLIIKWWFSYLGLSYVAGMDLGTLEVLVNE